MLVIYTCQVTIFTEKNFHGASVALESGETYMLAAFGNTNWFMDKSIASVRVPLGKKVFYFMFILCVVLCCVVLCWVFKNTILKLCLICFALPIYAETIFFFLFLSTPQKGHHVERRGLQRPKDRARWLCPQSQSLGIYEQGNTKTS